MKVIDTYQENVDYANALATLEQRLEYTFKDRGHLFRAMRHIARFERVRDDLVQVKSLESLGDGIVNHALEKIFPDPGGSAPLPPHFLNVHRESLRHLFQSNVYLSLCSLWLELDKTIRLPRYSQVNQEVEKKVRHLANTFERLVGALAKDDPSFIDSHTRLRKLLFPQGLSTPLMKAFALCFSHAAHDIEIGFKQLTQDDTASITYVDTFVGQTRVRYVTFSAGGYERTYEQRGNTYVSEKKFIRGFLLHFIGEFPGFLWQYAGLGHASIVYPFAEKKTREGE